MSSITAGRCCNRAALMPTREQLEAATEIVERRARELRGRLAIDYVVPDYWAKRPKPCMGGWGSTILNVTPQGKVLPCHAAASIPGLEFASVRDRPLRWIWQESPAFQRFRGTDWMPEPCRSCALKEVDFGGCRCQAMALAGDAARHRPGLRAVAAARGDVHRRARGIGGRAAAVRLPSPAQGSPGRRAHAPRRSVPGWLIGRPGHSARWKGPRVACYATRHRYRGDKVRRMRITRSRLRPHNLGWQVAAPGQGSGGPMAGVGLTVDLVEYLGTAKEPGGYTVTAHSGTSVMSCRCQSWLARTWLWRRRPLWTIR